MRLCESMAWFDKRSSDDGLICRQQQAAAGLGAVRYRFRGLSRPIDPVPSEVLEGAKRLFDLVAAVDCDIEDGHEQVSGLFI